LVCMESAASGTGPAPGGDGAGDKPNPGRRLASDPVSACSGSSEGTSCTYSGPGGNDVSGDCMYNDHETMVCMVKSSDDGGAGSGTGAIDNPCADLAADDECSFTDPVMGTTLTGACQETPLGELMCQPTPGELAGGDENQAASACSSSASGSSCSFSDPGGNTASGVCQDDGTGELACYPSGDGAGDIAKVPSESACDNLSADDTCSFTDEHDGESKSGACTLNPLGALVCMESAASGTGPAPGGDGAGDKPNPSLRGSA